MMLVSLLPLLILSLISIQYLSKSLEEETINQCKQSANEVKLQIDGYLDRPFNTIKVTAANPAVRAFDMPVVKPLLLQVQKVNPDIGLTLEDTKGNQLARGDQIQLLNVWERSHFQSALKGNEAAISDVIFSRSANALVVVLATPVRNIDTGAIVGVMQGAISLSKISDFVAGLSTNGTIAYVIDETGKILAHPDSNLVKDRVDMSEVAFVKTGLVEKKNGFSFIDDSKNGKKLVTYIYDQRTGWLVCMEVPYAIISNKIHSLSLILASVSVLIVVFICLVVFFVAKRFSDPILKIEKLASKIAQGDLTHKVNIDSKDEIGVLAAAFDTMVINLKKLIGHVLQNAQQVAVASEKLTASAEQSALAANQVASSITEVAQGTDQQHHIVGKTAIIVEEMSDRIQKVALNTNILSEQSTKAVKTAKEGGKSVEDAVKQMLEIEHTVSSSAQVVSHLGERSKEIGQIVDTISGIAGQTNLLALNAAIEAARAGEQGRGFAVVSEEVRKLAEQSQEAAKQIGFLISEIQGETNKAVIAMDEGTREVKAGTGIVNKAGQAFHEIIGLVNNLSVQVENISEAISHLASGSQKIVSSVQQIDKLTATASGEAQTVSAATEEQSASMEEIASSSQNLAKMAQDLQKAVSYFRI